MNSLDLVSVVVPVYNSEKYLKNCLESILNQNYSSIEILAIDDGSTDKSLEILKNYSDQIHILSQPNLGLAKALNSAIKKMKGRWLKWFSPDDTLYPDAIETLVNTTKKLPENTIIYSNWEIIDENNKRLRNFQESDYNDLSIFEFNVRLLDGQQINVNTSLIPSTLFKKGCFFQPLKDPVAIDYDFFLRAAILFNVNFHLVPQTLVKYRIHSNQLSHKNISNTLLYLSQVRQDILSKLDKSKREQYNTALKEYNKKKPISKKTIELGLKLATNTLPDMITDNLLTFYLNKIRSSRW